MLLISCKIKETFGKMSSFLQKKRPFIKISFPANLTVTYFSKTISPHNTPVHHSAQYTIPGT